ncbi:MAG TPA: hypothetical protein VE908_20160, partial [Mycobacterium sp.]|nr:hypothetical protein [Mycobacterium sp.]
RRAPGLVPSRRQLSAQLFPRVTGSSVVSGPFLVVNDLVQRAVASSIISAAVDMNPSLLNVVVQTAGKEQLAEA